MNERLGVSISQYEKKGDSFLDDIIYGKKNQKPCLDTNLCLERRNLVDILISTLVL